MVKRSKTLPPLPPRADGSTTPLRRWGTVQQACAYIPCSHTKLYELLNEGAIDAFKDPTRPGGPTYVDLDSIDAMKAKFVKYQPAMKAPKSATQEI